MKTNVRTIHPPVFTAEGSPAARVSTLAQLRRSVLACFLWEDSFYEDGADIVQRIRELVAKCSAADVAALAIEARTQFKLRHVPLLLVREMARNQNQRGLVAATLPAVIQRADELAEFLALYWRDGKDQPLAAQVKKGLAAAFGRFDEHQLAKYNRDGAVSLRDVLFMVHPRPADAKGRAKKAAAIARKGYARGEVARHTTSVLTRLAADELKTPDTWEVALSAGADKKATFERLIREEQLGALALLRNLRGMTEAKVDTKVVRAALDAMKVDRILPFRFIAAARHAPQFEPQLEQAMFRALAGAPKLGGKTVLLVDTSPSMAEKVSGKSELSRKDAAFGLAVLARELCEEVEIWAFSSTTAAVPPRRGFALSDAIQRAVQSNGTLLGHAIRAVAGRYDRLIVITDEQSQDTVSSPDKGKLAYMLNVSTERNGVGYGAWTRIDGWSEQAVRYIVETEKAGIRD